MIPRYGTHGGWWCIACGLVSPTDWVDAAASRCKMSRARYLETARLVDEVQGLESEEDVGYCRGKCRNSGRECLACEELRLIEEESGERMRQAAKGGYREKKQRILLSSPARN